MKRIIVRFNDNKQSVLFVVGENIKAFRKRNNCDAWYGTQAGRKRNKGRIGSIHLPSMVGMRRIEYNELITHEVTHLLIDWTLTRARSLSFVRRNEEQMATMAGEIVRKFWRGYERQKNQMA